MDEDTDYIKLPVEERCVHKVSDNVLKCFMLLSIDVNLRS